MADDLPIARGRGGNAPRPRPTHLALPQGARRAPAHLPAPGAVGSGPVVQALGAAQYLSALRGRPLAPPSQAPPPPDGVVRTRVPAAAGAQLSLRLVGGAGARARVSDASARLQALGLPADLGALALAAFED